jgi:hypothetical protein
MSGNGMGKGLSRGCCRGRRGYLPWTLRAVPEWVPTSRPSSFAPPGKRTTALT